MPRPRAAELRRRCVDKAAKATEKREVTALAQKERLLARA